MRDYHYKFLDTHRGAGETLVLRSPSDDAACELASDLLSRSESSFVEVRKGTKLIFQIGRAGSGSAKSRVESREPI